MFKIDDPKFMALIEKGIPIKRLERRLRQELGLKDWKAEERAHDGFDDYSIEGFLGKGESLLEVVYADWEIIEKYGTTHLTIARAIKKLISGKYKLHPDYEFREPTTLTPGDQNCPWGCKAYGQNAGIILKKEIFESQRIEATIIEMGGLTEDGLTDRMKSELKDFAKMVGKKPITQQSKDTPERSRKKGDIFYAPLTDLLPHLIEKHYFFEGRKSPYRADPAFLISALNLANHVMQ